MPARETDAINFANQLINLAAQARQMRQTFADLVKEYNSENYSAEWSAFPTATQNADGSLGVADGAPNTTHPIDTRVAAVSTLNRAVTETALVAMVTYMSDFANFLGNAAVTTSQRSQTLDDLAG